MDFQDQTLKCRDCGKDFVWTAAEQQFYQEKGFDNAPSRCPSCRAAKKAQLRGQRPKFKAVCAACGQECEVPFEPKGDRPVYCTPCWRAQAGQQKPAEKSAGKRQQKNQQRPNSKRDKR